MIAMTMAKTKAAGGAAVIRDVKLLRSIGCIDKPKAEEPKIWELFASVGIYPGVPKRYWNNKYKM